ncbi:MAG TPA: RNA polymerase subunit sigma, partial [Bacteroidia bacterium]|nr:RNA polymerase subunit sigma [Bacteroidia bacterium]
TRKEDTPEKWEAILQLFNQLLQLEYSPIAALNRTYAFSKAMGKEAGIKEAEKLGLDDNPYYHALLGELYTGMDNAMARDHFRNAVSRAKTSADKQILQKKIGKL